MAATTSRLGVSHLTVVPGNPRPVDDDSDDSVDEATTDDRGTDGTAAETRPDP